MVTCDSYYNVHLKSLWVGACTVAHALLPFLGKKMHEVPEKTRIYTLGGLCGSRKNINLISHGDFS